MRSIRMPALWALIATIHAVGAGYAWSMLAHGFAIGHPRFWSNEALPVLIVGVAIGCVAALWRKRDALAAFAIAMLAMLHAGMAAGWKLVFPISGGRVAEISAVVAVIVVAFAALALYRVRSVAILAGAVAGIMAGAVIAWAQRGADPATHPASPVRAFDPPGPATALPTWAELNAPAGVIAVRTGAVELAIQPLLTFYSRSPDRGWTVFSSDRDRVGPERRFAETRGDTSSYDGDEPAILRVTADTTLHVDAQTVLPAAVYAHLDSYTVLEVRGHHRLFVAFSPVPDQRIEVTYSEYPTGKPSRFAYLDAGGVFHVVQSTSGEKGPFHELAHGALPAGAALGLTLFDEATPIAHLELADFAAQASTQPSPTAGWGVPENAIEFSLAADRPDAPASFFITLAATSVGRGWDSVGHAPGLYRNRLDVRLGL